MARQASQLIATTFAATFLLASSVSYADVLRMEESTRTIVMEAPIDFVATPTRGMSMDSVRNAYGEPKESYPAVGQPPISRWDFEKFHVFFEHNMVLHAVVPNQPLRIDHQEELQPATVSELR